MITRDSIVRFVVKHPWFTAAALAAILFTGAAVVVISGVVPIKASSGHWPVTAAFLDFAKVRSVTTQSLGIKAPPLDDDGLILRGAGHYENGCLPCHGGPGARVPPVMAAMVPDPPDLVDTIPQWTAEQLFSIVKHGIKFTGMPGWPVQQRDDEVWAMVAFLRRMPALDAAAYRRLASGAPGAAPELPNAAERPPPRAVRDLCWRCHGADGTGRGPGAFPALAGQRSAYLYGSLQAFRDGRRFSGIMAEVAVKLDDATMRAVADYYEGLPARAAEAAADAEAVARGAAIAARGIPRRDIPACAECHGPAEQPKNPAYPRLASQHIPYLTSQLRLLKERRRGGSPHVALMHVFVDRLAEEDMRDVIQYFATLR